MAKNTFWVTDRRGNKLSKYHADMLAERVGDFVVYCTPDKKVRLAAITPTKSTRPAARICYACRELGKVLLHKVGRRSACAAVQPPAVTA